MENVLKTNSLTKEYHGIKALNDATVTLERGKIYGLIGRNGAGKTSMMRMIMGLGFPTSGSIELFGATKEKDLQRQRKRIGCIIETPSLVLNMTARENMKMYRLMRGGTEGKAEKEMLDFVGLTDTGKKKVKDFSLGMKQRLGLATALLTNPELLILDEPINGLDPIGVIEFRKLLKRLCVEQNITILISSHNLAELYQTATDYIFIDSGIVKQQITIDELDAKCQRYILISCSQPQKLGLIFESKLQTSNYEVTSDGMVKLYDYLDDKDKVANVLFESGIVATNLSVEGDTLEDYFVSIVGGGRIA